GYFLLQCMSPLLAQSRHSTTEFRVPVRVFYLWEAELSVSSRSPAANRLTNNDLRTRLRNFFVNFLATTGDFSSFNSETPKMSGQEGKNFQFRDTHILLAGARPYAPDPVSRSPAMRPTAAQ